MKKQLIFTGIGALLVISLFLGGNIVPKKIEQPTASKKEAKLFNINGFIKEAKQKLTPAQLTYLANLENTVTRGDVTTQQIQANTALANFWKDTTNTFAGQLILANLRSEQDEAKLNWETEQAIGLFEQALKINPTSADLKIGLGSCYIFGKGRFGGAAETMQGVQKVLEVVRTDSMNMKAQLVLGIGGYISGQYDKAIDRLTKVITTEPQNLEAIAFLADTYAAKGDKQEAIKWYQLSKRMANDPHYTEEVDQRIKELK